MPSDSHPTVERGRRWGLGFESVRVVMAIGLKINGGERGKAG